MVSKDEVMKVLQSVYDPEIPVSIVDLGLIYEVNVDKSSNVHIKMTCTTPYCPMNASMQKEVNSKTKAIKGVKDVKVDMVFDPPWTPDRIAPEARKELGIK
ncbi:MAG: iron-sulfur cluster assembly protein [Promethearchaeati archaeon SRVP18_Atabeyarchaeia-1]